MRKLRIVVRLVVVACVVGAALVAPNAAQPERIRLWPEGVPGQLSPVPVERSEDGRILSVSDPELIVYPAPGPGPHPAVIVCPGGSYLRLAIQHEGHDVAAWLNSIGVSAYVLKYRLREYGHPAPLQDVLRSVRLLRNRARSLQLRPDAIGVLGFSAGGHVAASAATLFEAAEGRTGAALDAVSARPDFAMLLYPVITMEGAAAHAGSRRNLLGEAPDEERVARYSLDRQVTSDTPPVFLVHGMNDTVVPVENALRFAAAMNALKRPVDVHFFANGPHGFGLGAGVGGPVAGWPTIAASWMRSLGVLQMPDPRTFR